MQQSNNINTHCWRLLILFLSLIIIRDFSFSQVIQKTNRNVMRVPQTNVSARIAGSIPQSNRVIDQRIRINPGISNVFRNTLTTDTIWDLEKYLTTKNDCDLEKTMDDSGCIIIRYNDGFIKKVCGENTVEVITPDGRKHVSGFGPMSMMMAIIPIPVPPDPSADDQSFRWINGYNDQLLVDIKNYLGDTSRIQHYNTREQRETKGSVYQQIQYRTIFIEQFLKAK